jgi:electron transfer flavoprotein beta subunit
MKIAVCFKVLPDFDQVVEADWDAFNLAAGWAYVKRVFGCFDESALETALRLRSAWTDAGEAAECTAVTAAPLPSPLCKTLFAAGFDRVADLSGIFQDQNRQAGGGSLPPASAGAVPPPSSAAPSAGEPPRNAPLPPPGPEAALLNSQSSEFRPRHIAAVLGNFLGPAAYDLILAGRQAGYADTGAVPLSLAEFLGIPVLTEVEELSPCAGGLEVKRTNGSGRERLRVRLPLLAVLGNSPVSALRAVTLSARMAASKREAEKPPAPCGPASSPAGENPDSGGAFRFIREDRRKTCRFLPAGAELARSVAEIRAAYLGGWEK